MTESRDGKRMEAGNTAEKGKAAGEAAPSLTVGADEGLKTILVVDDEMLVRRYASHVLRGKEYRILEAGDGEEALSVSEGHEGPIHLLLTDLMMPHMNGKELANRLCSLRPEIKVLYMSGYAGDLLLEHKVCTTEMFLPKPFAPEHLVERVRTVLDPQAPE